VNGRVVSIQVGLPRDLGDWRTAFFKKPVFGPVWLGWLGLDGDRQADPRYHGGPDKAVLAYSADHYAAWREDPGFSNLAHGAFAENFTIAGLDEATVCIGDKYRVGEAFVEVSQPRGPCWKIARRWKRPDLTARVAKTGRTGWYLRVLGEGYVEAGDEVSLVERPLHAVTMREAGLRPHGGRSS